ncbi:MAG: histidine kinase [Halalkalicoccus sp.]|nr:histidine kinase [Halalkalicoccus sp.]
MATRTVDSDRIAVSGPVAGAIGGFLGSVLMGLQMQFVNPSPTLELVIPAMYGIEGPTLMAGWMLHQVHGVVLGVVYALLVRVGPVSAYARRLDGAIVLGIGYGVLTTAVLSALVMPLWLLAVGFPNPPPFPNVTSPAILFGLLGHVVYALVLAVVYATMVGPATPTTGT